MGTKEDIGYLGAWLRDELERRGYELDGKRAGGKTRFANKADVSLSIISRILSEGRVPDPPALRKIGAALDRTLGEMMVIAGQATPADMTIRDPAEERQPPEPGPPPDLPDNIDWSTLSESQQDVWHVRHTSVSTRLTLAAVVEAQAAAEALAGNPRTQRARAIDRSAKSA